MILVYLENNGAKLPKSALIAAGAAKRMKEAHGYAKLIAVLIGGPESATAAGEAAQLGFDEVCVIKGENLKTYLAPTYAEVLTKAVQELKPKAVLGASTSRGKDFFPRVAAAIGAGQASDVISFQKDGIFTRPMYAGNVLADVQLTTDIKVVTIRPAAFEAMGKSGSAAQVRELSIAATAASGTEFVNYETVASERPELGDAEIVVSGGRALKSAENFTKFLLPLADALGAALGASRAAVDSGYVPNDWQVGQTGKVVAPKLYIAVGISGAIQHLAGMKDSKVIVAINKDAEAPIFEIADYGLVGDLFEILPELTAEIGKRRAQS